MPCMPPHMKLPALFLATVSISLSLKSPTSITSCLPKTNRTIKESSTLISSFILPFSWSVVAWTSGVSSFISRMSANYHHVCGLTMISAHQAENIINYRVYECGGSFMIVQQLLDIPEGGIRTEKLIPIKNYLAILLDLCTISHQEESQLSTHKSPNLIAKYWCFTHWRRQFSTSKN